jgi:ribonuclease P protein subunit RPR2
MKPTQKQRKARKGEADLQELLTLAASNVQKNPVLSRNAVRDVMRLSQTMRIRVPLEEKRKLCRNCFTYLVPGVTSATRVAKGRVIITCLHCKHVKRLQFRR